MSKQNPDDSTKSSDNHDKATSNPYAVFYSRRLINRTTDEKSNNSQTTSDQNVERSEIRRMPVNYVVLPRSTIFEPEPVNDEQPSNLRLTGQRMQIDETEQSVANNNNIVPASRMVFVPEDSAEDKQPNNSKTTEKTVKNLNQFDAELLDS